MDSLGRNRQDEDGRGAPKPATANAAVNAMTPGPR
jgi:hypothetical protein